MRPMPGCGTVQDPLRAAVLPARGGIGPGERPARADPGDASGFTGQRRRSHSGGGRWTLFVDQHAVTAPVEPATKWVWERLGRPSIRPSPLRAGRDHWSIFRSIRAQ